MSIVNARSTADLQLYANESAVASACGSTCSTRSRLGSDSTESRTEQTAKTHFAADLQLLITQFIAKMLGVATDHCG